jgi:protease PrsW
VPGDPRLLLQLALPVVPGLVWLWIFYRTDLYQPEPKRLVLATFGLGVLAIVPAFAAERAAQTLAPLAAVFDGPLGDSRPLTLALVCFLVIGPAEELAKFAAVRAFAYRQRDFDEPIDGIVYAAAAALGFASLENVLYVIDFERGTVRWAALGLRSFLALPGHVIFSAMWGYALGRARFSARYRVWPRVALAAALHGLYDFLLLYPPAHALIILYMCVLGPILWQMIRLLRARSPFAPDPLVAAEAPARAVQARHDRADGTP